MKIPSQRNQDYVSLSIEDTWDEPAPHKKRHPLLALCCSEDCLKKPEFTKYILGTDKGQHYLRPHQRGARKRTSSVIEDFKSTNLYMCKDVSRDKILCPDCFHALFWVRAPKP